MRNSEDLATFIALWTLGLLILLFALFFEVFLEKEDCERVEIKQPGKVISLEYNKQEIKLSNLSYRPNDLEKQTIKVSKTQTEDVWLKPTTGSSLKPYMDYKMITDISTPQYKLINSERSREDERGFLMYDNDFYCVALGSYFGDVGTKYIFTLSTGKQIKVIKAEAKSDSHTCKDNYLSWHGHIVEFLINTNSKWMKENKITLYGSLNYYDELSGDIVKIERILE